MFGIDIAALAIIFLLWTLYTFILNKKPRGHEDSMLYPIPLKLSKISKSFKQRCITLPYCLKYLALFLFVVAFLNPQISHIKHEKSSLDEAPNDAAIQTLDVPKEGIAIYMLLDQSSSMAEKMSSPSQKEGRAVLSKIEVLKKITKDFIIGNKEMGFQGRKSDLIGLISFARTAHVIAPLTFDHDCLVQELDLLSTVQNAEEDGTAIGYAIYKTVNLIQSTRHFIQGVKGNEMPCYELKSSIIIVVTDGLQSCHPDDQKHIRRSLSLDSAASFAANHGVRVYMINVEPAIGFQEFNYERNLLQKAMEVTGGKLYIANYKASLKAIYQDIDRLEKSSFVEKIASEEVSSNLHPNIEKLPLYPYFVFWGMVCLFLSVFLEATFLRSLP